MSAPNYHRVIVGPAGSGVSTLVDQLVAEHLAERGVVWLARPRSATPPNNTWPWPGFTVTPGAQWTTSNGGHVLNTAAHQVTEATVSGRGRFFGTEVLVVLDEVDLLKTFNREWPDTDPATRDLARILEHGEDCLFRLLLTTRSEEWAQLSTYVLRVLNRHAAIQSAPVGAGLEQATDQHAMEK